jgi:hypothetical protein
MDGVRWLKERSSLVRYLEKLTWGRDKGVTGGRSHPHKDNSDSLGRLCHIGQGILLKTDEITIQYYQ